MLNIFWLKIIFLSAHDPTEAKDPVNKTLVYNSVLQMYVTWVSGTDRIQSLTELNDERH